MFFLIKNYICWWVSPTYIKMHGATIKITSELVLRLKRLMSTSVRNYKFLYLKPYIFRRQPRAETFPNSKETNILSDLHLRYSLIKFWFFSDFLKLEVPVIEYLWQTGLAHTSGRTPGAHPASYVMSTASFLALNRPGCGVDYPPSHSADVKERV